MVFDYFLKFLSPYSNLLSNVWSVGQLFVLPLSAAISMGLHVQKSVGCRQIKARVVSQLSSQHHQNMFRVNVFVSKRVYPKHALLLVSTHAC